MRLSARACSHQYLRATIVRNLTDRYKALPFGGGKSYDIPAHPTAAQKGNVHATIDQALAVEDKSYQDKLLANRGAILVLLGAYSEALETLSAQLKKVDPQDSYCLRFTQATCLLHMERYKEAIAAYKKVIAAGVYLGDEGLEAARLGQQPDWDNL